MPSAAHPQMRLNRDVLDRNIAAMSAWCATHDVALAPHIKTTMSRPIVERQVAAGADGVTVATVDQAATAVEWGVGKVLIANEIVEPALLAGLRDLTAAKDVSIRCFVDSVDGVAIAEAVYQQGPNPLEVLVDVGTPRGRTGVRTTAEARRVAERAASSAALRLVGVAGYEGVVANERSQTVIEAVDQHCSRVREAFTSLSDLFETAHPVFSMGGSAFPDRVALAMPAPSDVTGTVRLLRSGCYVTHDHGTYARVSPIPGLQPALTVSTLVVSCPEPGMVVLNAGKRDLPYDAGLPVVLAGRATDGTVRDGFVGIVRTLYDHHTVVVCEGQPLRIGDEVTLGISHPCSAFDRWPEFVVVDDSGRQVDVWTSHFARRRTIH